MQPSDRISPEKARKILKDGTVRGHKLTKRQRGMFGAAVGRAKQIHNALQANLDSVINRQTITTL